MSVLCALPPCTERVNVTRRIKQRGGPWFCRSHQYAGDVFVRRLEHLARVRVQYASEINNGGARLLDVSIAATYADCCDLGREGEAEKIMHEMIVCLAAGGGL